MRAVKPARGPVLVVSTRQFDHLGCGDLVFLRRLWLGLLLRANRRCRGGQRTYGQDDQRAARANLRKFHETRAGTRAKDAKHNAFAGLSNRNTAPGPEGPAREAHKRWSGQSPSQSSVAESVIEYDVEGDPAEYHDRVVLVGYYVKVLVVLTGHNRGWPCHVRDGVLVVEQGLAHDQVAVRQVVLVVGLNPPEYRQAVVGEAAGEHFETVG